MINILQARTVYNWKIVLTGKMTWRKLISRKSINSITMETLVDFWIHNVSFENKREKKVKLLIHKVYCMSCKLLMPNMKIENSRERDLKWIFVNWLKLSNCQKTSQFLILWMNIFFFCGQRRTSNEVLDFMHKKWAMDVLFWTWIERNTGLKLNELWRGKKTSWKTF